MGDPRSIDGLLAGDVGLWLALLRRQWFVLCATFAVILVGTVIAAAWYPWKYESVAKFLVRNARQDLVVNPNDKTAGVFREDVTEEVINSEIELIRSRDILERVAREVLLPGPEVEANRRVALEGAIAQLGGSLDVSGMRRTNLIRVSYRAHDPEQAAEVLRHLADAYLSLHLTVHSSPGTYAFFKAQAVHWRTELEAAQAELVSLAGTRNLIAPEDQRRSALDSGSATEQALVNLEAEIREQTTRQLAAERALAGVDPRIVTQKRTLPNQASVERAHTMMVELKNKRTELLTKFKADDRLVQQVDEQLANTEAALREATQMTAVEEATDVNPAWQRLHAERDSAALALAGLRSKAERLRAQVSDFRSRAVTIAEAAPRYDTLVRRVVDARDQFAVYTRRAEEARLDEALDRQKISNVVLAEAPQSALAPQRPRLALVLIVGSLLGGLAAAGAALVSDWLITGTRSRTRLVDGYTTTSHTADASEA